MHFSTNNRRRASGALIAALLLALPIITTMAQTATQEQEQIVPTELDLQLTARVVRERLGVQISLAHREAGDLVVLGGEEVRGRHAFDMGGLVNHLASKHDWIEALRDEDHVARIRVHEFATRPERLDEVVAEVAMGRSMLEG